MAHDKDNEEVFMSEVFRTADSKGRVSLPGFANSTVVIEAVSANEYRVRKARVIPEDELLFPEQENPRLLTEQAARQFLEMIQIPPKPNAALRRAVKRFKKNHE
jgi:Protein of unknown function (DUF1778)